MWGVNVHINFDAKIGEWAKEGGAPHPGGGWVGRPKKSLHGAGLEGGRDRGQRKAAPAAPA